MPSVSEKQARLMASDYGKAKAGKPTRTGMSAQKLRHWVMSDARRGMLKKKSEE